MRTILCLSLAASMAAIPASAGTLEEFETNATRGAIEGSRDASARERSEAGAGRSGRFGESLGQEIAESLGDLVVYGVVGGILYGGAASWARVTQPPASERRDAEEVSRESEAVEVAPRRPGEALIPFARFDAGYQFVASDVSALDLRAEAGYAMAAIQVRRTEYREKEPKDDLETTGIHALYRMSFGNHFEMDIGLGALVLQRDGSRSGFSFTLPILIHPSDRFGIEFRPAWSDLGGSTIQDYDVTVLVGVRYVSARAGYRWVRAGFAHLDGPEVGVAVRW